MARLNLIKQALNYQKLLQMHNNFYSAFLRKVFFSFSSSIFWYSGVDVELSAHKNMLCQIHNYSVFVYHEIVKEEPVVKCNSNKYLIFKIVIKHFVFFETPPTPSFPLSKTFLLFLFLLLSVVKNSYYLAMGMVIEFIFRYLCTLWCTLFDIFL